MQKLYSAGIFIVSPPLSSLQIWYYPKTNESYLPFHQILASGVLLPEVDSGISERTNSLKFNLMVSFSDVTLDFLAQLVRWHPKHFPCLFLKASVVPGSPLTITFTLSVVLKSALAVGSWPAVRPWFSTKMGGAS